jgi:two-component system CheB/CheR fusion protein
MYKKNTLDRRIERRMSIHKLDKISSYVRFLQENPQELELLFKELLIGVTSFFRDPEAWDKLRDEIIPALLDTHRAGVLRAWSLGCSTGEEAYSQAIVFKEALEQIKPEANFMLQIFATDLDRDGIDKARQGIYPANIAADVSAARLRRFFVKEEGGYRVGKEIREMVTFATQNVVKDPSFTKLDILICRNLLIYLTPEVQKRLLPLFHYSLNPGGVLFLGSSESVSSSTELFAPLSTKLRLFGRRETVMAEPVVFPASFAPALSGEPTASAGAKPLPNLQSLADQVLLQAFSRPAVLVKDRGTSSTSTDGQGNILSRLRARPTGLSTPWPAQGSGLTWESPFKKPFGKKGQSPSRVSRSGRTTIRRGWISRSRRSRSRRHCGGWP